MAEDQEVLASTVIRELGDLSRELGKLTDTPAWVRLQAEFDKVREQYIIGQVRKLTAGNIKADPVDQRAIDYQRGFFRGCEFILAMPERSTKAHQAAIERQET